MKKPEPYPPLRGVIRFAPGVLLAIPKLYEMGLRAVGTNSNAVDGFFGISNWYWLGLGLMWVVGAFTADFTNPNSWIRRFLRWRSRYADLDLIGLRYEIINEIETQALVVQLQFICDVDASISIKLRGCIKNGKPQQNEVLPIREKKHYHKGEKVAFPLYQWRKKQPPNWLPNHGGRPPFIGTSRNIVDIQIKSWRTQRYRLYIQSLTPSDGWPPIFYMGEDFDALETAEGIVAP